MTNPPFPQQEVELPDCQENWEWLSRYLGKINIFTTGLVSGDNADACGSGANTWKTHSTCALTHATGSMQEYAIIFSAALIQVSVAAWHLAYLGINISTNPLYRLHNDAVNNAGVANSVLQERLYGFSGAVDFLHMKAFSYVKLAANTSYTFTLATGMDATGISVWLNAPENYITLIT